MSDPLRDETRLSPSGEPDVDRDAKIQELLLAGLDHYFSGNHDEAIHVWTRVLFLDRGHTSARAYIERARSAQAERHRESEELLHSGEAAFDRGDIGEARQLLTSSVDRGGPQDVTLALLERVERLQGASGQPGLTPRQARRPLVARQHIPVPLHAPRHRRGLFLAVATLLVLAGVYGLQTWDVESLISEREAAPAAVLAPPDTTLPMPTGGELLLSRARLQFERGHLNEALSILERVQIGDPLKTEADALRSSVQRALLAATTIDAGTPGAAPTGTPSSR